jgi:hypothetical protein
MAAVSHHFLAAAAVAVVIITLMVLVRVVITKIKNVGEIRTWT